MNKATTFKTFEETATTIKAVAIKDNTLIGEKITIVYNCLKKLHFKTMQPVKVISREIVREEVETVSFPLISVTPEELQDYRKNKIPTFILKIDGNLMCSEIPANMTGFSSDSLLGMHKCAISGHECHRLSAASDEEGGCAKVRNLARGIERYPWITKGYETFNTNHDSFIVTNCSHYEPSPPREQRKTIEINAKKLGLAQLLWDDVTCLDEARRRARENKNDNPFVCRY